MHRGSNLPLSHCCVYFISLFLVSAHLFEEVDDCVAMVTDRFRPVSGIAEISVGQGGVALFEENGSYYRATVRSITRDSIEVSGCLATVTVVTITFLF